MVKGMGTGGERKKRERETGKMEKVKRGLGERGMKKGEREENNGNRNGKRDGNRIWNLKGN